MGLGKKTLKLVNIKSPTKQPTSTLKSPTPKTPTSTPTSTPKTSTSTPTHPVTEHAVELKAAPEKVGCPKKPQDAAVALEVEVEAPDVVPRDVHDHQGAQGRVQDLVQDLVQGAEGGGGPDEAEVVDERRDNWRLTGDYWLQRAREEVHEDPDNTPACLERLRALVQGDCELRARTDEAFLMRFLRARKFNVPRAFKTVQRYYQMKRKHPNLFRADNTDRLQDMMCAELHGVLDGRDKDGCKVLVVRIDRYNADRLTVDDFFRLNVVALEQMVREPETQVAGLRVIVDLSGLGRQHASFLSPYYVKNTSEVIQESFPLRFKGFHVVNEPFYFSALFSIIKPFLKDKMKSRVILHGSRYSELQQLIPAELLPEEYGGPGGAAGPGGQAFQFRRWANSVRELEGYFKRIERFGYLKDVDAPATTS